MIFEFYIYMSDPFGFQMKNEDMVGKKLSGDYRLNEGDYLPDNELFIGGLVVPSIKKKQLRILSVLMFGVVVILIGRIFWLQVVKGERYRNIAEGNRIRLAPIKAERGLIYDRNFQPLVKNVPIFSLALIPGDLPKNSQERKEILGKISELIGPISTAADAGLDPDKIENELEKLPYSYQPTIIKENLDYQSAMKLMLELKEVPGVVLEIESQRKYLSEFSGLFSHVLGYMGKISPEELQSRRTDYLLTDFIGKTGLEAQYETLLKGKNGQKRIEVNSLGKEERVVSQEPPEGGRDLVLCLDADLQKKSAEVLMKYLKINNSRAGTVIALNPENGELLSIFSYPAYDNNIFTQSASNKESLAFLQDPDSPMLFRAISGEYPPGSVIKLLTAAGALAEGIINQQTTILSQGGIKVNQWFFADWKEGGHGQTNLIKALAESVNTFFYYLGGGFGDFKGLGIEKINYYFRLFGLGQKTGIDLPNESKGFIATQEWKQGAKNEPWYIGDTYHISIGQGDILVTPLQVANYTAAVANGGFLFKPHLVKELSNFNSGQKIEIIPEIIGQDLIKSDYFSLIKQGLRAAVTEGSARRLADLSVAVAGKTGTAQVAGNEKSHAWFTGFAPYENPKIVLTILIENGGEGSVAAVPAAKEIFEWWFKYKNL